MILFAGIPPPITYFKVSSQVLGTVTFEWNFPTSEFKMFKLGTNFHFRRDIAFFEIDYREFSATSMQLVKLTGDFKDTTYLTKIGAISGLTPGVTYKFRIRCTDLGNQPSEWSDTLVHTMCKFCVCCKFIIIYYLISFLNYLRQKNIFN